MSKLKVLELFSGYGGASFTLKQIGVEHETIGYSDIEDCANYIYDLNHNGKPLGDVTKIDEKKLQDFNLLTGGFPCFLAGTLITTQRGQIPIEKVVIGDMVLTHMNRWRKVIDTMSHMRDHYYKVNIQGAGEINTTGNHEFYGKKMIKVWDNSKRQSFRQWSDTEWIPVDEMRNDDFFTIGTWSDKYATNEKKLTKEECWLLGRYVADGCLVNNGKNKFKSIWTIGKNKVKEMKKILDKSKYKYYNYEERTVHRFIINNNEHFYNLCLECGKGAVNKKVPHWIINLPTNKLKHFLDGYMTGDGCFTKNGYQATTVSKVLAHQLGQIVIRLFKTPYNITFTERPKTTVIEGRTVNQKDTWIVRWKEEIQKGNNAEWIGKNLWVRFNSKEKVMDKVKTYNITVEEDHSYVANNIVVANCQSFSITGKREGFAAVNKGKLFFDIVRIAEYKQPRYMVLENVQGLLSHQTFLNKETIKNNGEYKIYNNLKWEEQNLQNFSMNLLETIINYIQKKLDIKLISQKAKLDIFYQNKVLDLEMLEKEVELGLKKKLIFYLKKISQIIKKQNYYKTEVIVPLGLKEEDLDLILKKLSLKENISVKDIYILEKITPILNNQDIILKKILEENLNQQKLFITSMEINLTTEQKIYVYVQEINIINIIIKLLKSQKSLLKEELLSLINKKDMWYVKTFEIVLSELKRIGYYVKWKLLKSKELGTPQNRPRVWIMCFKNFDDYNNFVFPEKKKLEITVKDILEDEVDEKYYLTDKQLENFNNRNRYGDHKLDYNDIIHPTLCSIGQSDVAIIPEDFKIADFRYDEGLRVRKDNVSPTLKARKRDIDLSGQPIINNKSRYRRLTPRECFRLMGFFNDEIEFGNLKDNKLYFLAGNGWDINVAAQIFTQLFKENKNSQRGVFDFI